MTKCKTTADKIKVMQAAVDGKRIELKVAHPVPGNWHLISFDCIDTFKWNWDKFDYRIAEIDDSINWNHVSDEYNYLCTFEFYGSKLLKVKPTYSNYHMLCTSQNGVCANAKDFSSFKRGTKLSIDGLVIRPGYKEND